MVTQEMIITKAEQIELMNNAQSWKRLALLRLGFKCNVRTNDIDFMTSIATKTCIGDINIEDPNIQEDIEMNFTDVQVDTWGKVRYEPESLFHTLILTLIKGSEDPQWIVRKYDMALSDYDKLSLIEEKDNYSQIMG